MPNPSALSSSRTPVLVEVHANLVLSDYGGAVARDQCRDRVRARCPAECCPFVLLDWHLPGDVVDAEFVDVDDKK